MKNYVKYLGVISAIMLLNISTAQAFTAELSVFDTNGNFIDECGEWIGNLQASYKVNDPRTDYGASFNMLPPYLQQLVLAAIANGENYPVYTNYSAGGVYIGPTDTICSALAAQYNGGGNCDSSEITQQPMYRVEQYPHSCGL